jgi:hypothetical protein
MFQCIQCNFADYRPGPAVGGDAVVGWYDFAYEGGSFKVCFRPGGKCVGQTCNCESAIHQVNPAPLVKDWYVPSQSCAAANLRMNGHQRK